MKYTHFDDIRPNHRTDFVMLYFAACRSLRELQAAIRRTNGGKLTCRQAWLLRRINNTELFFLIIPAVTFISFL